MYKVVHTFKFIWGVKRHFAPTFSSFLAFLSFGRRFLKNLHTHQPQRPMMAQTRTEIMEPEWLSEKWFSNRIALKCDFRELNRFF